MKFPHKVIRQQLRCRDHPIDHLTDILLRDPVLNLLFQVVEVRLADRIAEKLTRFGSQAIALFLAEEGLAVVGLEGHQALARNDSTNFSTFSERTWSAGTTRFSSCAEALVERTTNRRRASADIVCLVIAPSVVYATSV